MFILHVTWYYKNFFFSAHFLFWWRWLIISFFFVFCANNFMKRRDRDRDKFHISLHVFIFHFICACIVSMASKIIQYYISIMCMESLLHSSAHFIIYSIAERTRAAKKILFILFKFNLNLHDFTAKFLFPSPLSHSPQ